MSIPMTKEYKRSTSISLIEKLMESQCNTKPDFKHLYIIKLITC